MSKHYLVICNAYPKKYDQYYLRLSGCDTASSSVIYSNSVISGLSLNGLEYDAISAASVGHYPFTSKTKKLDGIQYDSHFFGVGYSNHIVTSQSSKTKAIYKKIKSLNYKKDDEINIIVTDVHAPFLKAAYKTKKKFKNAKVILICLDLPQYVFSSSKNIILKLMKKMSVKQVTNLAKKADGYVFLSDYMKGQFGDDKKPSIISPGILDTSIYDGISRERLENTSFVYCGVLSKQYNIDFLLKSFSMISNPNYRLVLAGKGDMTEDIKKLTKIDKRVIYLGEITREEAYKLQFIADVLVNPRIPASEYTKLSFPSKTISYLYSGNPLVCFSLPSFPEEINAVIVQPKSITESSFAEAMELAVHKNNSKQIDVALHYSEKNVVSSIVDLFGVIRKNGNL